MSLFGGIKSVTAMRNTNILSNVVTPKLIFSPLAGGIRKPMKPTRVMTKQGRIMLKM